MNYLQLFAHAGETHETIVESTSHALAWYVQLPLFLLAVAGLYALSRVLFKTKSTAFLVDAFILLIAGFGLYKVAPVVSATAITIGMTTTLLVTLIGLGAESREFAKKKAAK
jgi:hypothetical protein